MRLFANTNHNLLSTTQTPQKTILRVAFVMKGGVKFNSMWNDILLELLVPYFRNNRVKYNSVLLQSIKTRIAVFI